jgi:hypothetical protein
MIACQSGNAPFAKWLYETYPTICNFGAKYRTVGDSSCAVETGMV